MDLECASNSTPLHAASYFGHASILEFFARSGNDLDKKNIYGNSALDEAHDTDIVKIL